MGNKQRVGKPYICFRDGYWRVGHMPGCSYEDWEKAHKIIAPWNAAPKDRSVKWNYLSRLQAAWSPVEAKPMRRYQAPAKPHIYFRGGYWRVTHMPKPWSKNMCLAPLWNKAHDLVIEYNGGCYPGPLDRLERLRSPWSETYARK